MADKRFTTVTKEGRRKHVVNYGTMDSDSLPGSKSCGSHQEAEKRTSKRYRGMIYTMIVICGGLALIWILSSLKNQGDTTVAWLLPPMSHHPRRGPNPQFLGVIERDSNAHNTNLATQRSLYLRDKLTTTASDGMFRLT